MSKTKGIRAERELIHLFWATPDWIAARIAGSGSMRYPAPDIIAGNDERKLVIEAKISKDPRIYIPRAEIEALLIFAAKFRAQALLAYRFDRQDWKFIAPEHCEHTDKHYVITTTTRGISFDDMIIT